MNIVDYLIIIIILLFTIKGFKNGAIKELITFGGFLIVLVAAFFLKNPVSILLYEKLPFFSFGGLFAGVSVLNIILYELLAFLIVTILLLIVYRILILATNVVDVILKATIILEIPSKILGIFVGAVEGLIIVFIFLFLALQFDNTKQYIDTSKFGHEILVKTPVLSSATDSIYRSIQEISELAKNYKDIEDKNDLNLQALNIILKYKVIEPKNAQSLVDSGKLKMEGAESLIKSYTTSS